MGPTPYQYLPLWAKIAIERLDCDSALRSESMFDELLAGYARSYGEQVDEHIATRNRRQPPSLAHAILQTRFPCTPARARLRPFPGPWPTLVPERSRVPRASRSLPA